MPRFEDAATVLTLIVGIGFVLPSPAEAEQSSSQSPTQSQVQPLSYPVSDAGNDKPTETRNPEERTTTADSLQMVRETDRLMRWLNESALWTGIDERTRARSIRFR